MKCLIIAAGKGSRLANKGDSKPLVEINGVPLIGHVILTALQAGVNEFFIITGHNNHKLEEYLSPFSHENNFRINFIHNKEWEKPNGISVYCAHKTLKEPFFLLMSDHLFDFNILKNLKAEGINNDEVKLAVDFRITNNPLVDIDDVTKVLTQKRRIIDIGKTLDNYNAFDTGIFFCTPKLFEALAESFEEGDMSLSGGIRKMAHQNKAKIFNIGNRNWIDIDDEKAFNKAEKIFAFINQKIYN